MASYKDHIEELIRENGWTGQLEVETLADTGGVRVRLSAQHRTAPGAVVNDYIDGVNPLEQVMQECLRALRTGRPGI